MLLFLDDDESEPLLETLHDDKKRRDEEQQGDCSDKHSSDNPGSERTVAVGAGSAGIKQRQHAENECQKRHQNRAQTNPCRIKRSLFDAHSGLTALGRVFGNENGRLGQQSDDHDHTGLKVDVVFHTEEIGGGKTPQNAERNGKYDGQRHKETLVERT